MSYKGVKEKYEKILEKFGISGQIELYRIYPGYRRKGYAYEAVSALLSLVQEELHLDLILAGVIKENKPSIALLKKLGFQREGFMRKGFWSAKQGPVDIERFYRDRI